MSLKVCVKNQSINQSLKKIDLFIYQYMKWYIYMYMYVTTAAI